MRQITAIEPNVNNKLESIKYFRKTITNNILSELENNCYTCCVRHKTLNMLRKLQSIKVINVSMNEMK